MTNLPKAEIGALHRCDGMGERAEDGDYVLIAVKPDLELQRFLRISLGAAAVLIDELLGYLAAAGRGQKPLAAPPLSRSQSIEAMAEGLIDIDAATQEFRLQNDREWRAKLDHLKAENAELRKTLARYEEAK